MIKIICLLIWLLDEGWLQGLWTSAGRVTEAG